MRKLIAVLLFLVVTPAFSAGMAYQNGYVYSLQQDGTLYAFRSYGPFRTRTVIGTAGQYEAIVHIKEGSEDALLFITKLGRLQAPSYSHVSGRVQKFSNRVNAVMLAGRKIENVLTATAVKLGEPMQDDVVLTTPGGLFSLRAVIKDGSCSSLLSTATVLNIEQN